MTAASEPLEPGLSVVVPVYGGQATLTELVERLGAALPELASAFEVVFVNDASPDGSQAEIERLAADHPWVRWIQLRRNFGQHAAVLCGLRAARHDVTVTMDDDLQHRPELIGRLLAELTPDVDVVYGAPEREQHGLLRDLASRATKWVLASSMGADVAPMVSAFRVLRTELREGFTQIDGAYVQLDVLLTWATRRFVAIRVPHDERKAGTSGYSFGKLVRVAMELVTGFSDRPLRIASIVGLGFALFGLGLLVFVVVQALLVDTFPGFAFLASSIAIFSGVQLVALGVMGEYVARVHSRTMRRPVYVIRDHGGGAAGEDGSADEAHDA